LFAKSQAKYTSYFQLLTFTLVMVMHLTAFQGIADPRAPSGANTRQPTAKPWVKYKNKKSGFRRDTGKLQ
jgi:hypothetical protein